MKSKHTLSSRPLPTLLIFPLGILLTYPLTAMQQTPTRIALSTARTAALVTGSYFLCDCVCYHGEKTRAVGHAIESTTKRIYTESAKKLKVLINSANIKNETTLRAQLEKNKQKLQEIQDALPKNQLQANKLQEEIAALQKKEQRTKQTEGIKPKKEKSPSLMVKFSALLIPTQP